MPKVSIIITTHSRPQLLPRAIESAKASGTDIETIVVDDASTDETAIVCKAFSDIRYVRLDPNRGVAGARNAGVSASRSEYITFLDDDDVRLPNSLDRQIEALESEPDAAMIYGQTLVVNQTNGLTSLCYPKNCPRGDIFWELLGQNFIPCGSAVFRRSCIDRVGLLDASVPRIDDWDFWIRIAELYPVAAWEMPVMIWRKPTPLSEQGTSKASEIVTLSTRQFRNEWLRLPKAAQASPRKRRNAWRQFSRNMARHLMTEAFAALTYGCFAEAWRNMLTALRLHPAGILRAISRSKNLRLTSANRTTAQVCPAAALSPVKQLDVPDQNNY